MPLLRGKGLDLILEPGRSISGNSGIMLTRVLYTKRSVDKNVAIVDGAMNDLIRPMLYEAFHFIWPAKGAQKVPDSVSDEEAALVEPLRTSIGIVKSAELTLGDSVVITGAGKIGLGVLLCAKLAGATPVIVIDVVKSRLDKALEMGADVVINANEADVISEVVKLTKVGPDAILICSRAGRVLNQATDMARRGGTIVLAGFVPPTEINPVTWVLKNLRLIGELGTSPLSLSMRLIANKQVNVKPLISAIMPLEDVQKAFDSMYSGENITVLLRP